MPALGAGYVGSNPAFLININKKNCPLKKKALLTYYI